VWSRVRTLGGIDNIAPRVHDVVEFLIRSFKGSSASGIIARLFLVATCYFIWHERNARLKTCDKIYVDIVVCVRLKVLAFRFKKYSLRLMLDWLGGVCIDALNYFDWLLIMVCLLLAGMLVSFIR
ncbi:hypothetical protein Tco_0853553, partial [Tanacetum coccineum]